MKKPCRLRSPSMESRTDETAAYAEAIYSKVSFHFPSKAINVNLYSKSDIDIPIILILFQQIAVILLANIIIRNPQNQLAAKGALDGKHAIIE